MARPASCLRPGWPWPAARYVQRVKHREPAVAGVGRLHGFRQPFWREPRKIIALTSYFTGQVQGPPEAPESQTRAKAAPVQSRFTALNGRFTPAFGLES